jgi:osmotically-inducible protein OsmY
MRTLILLALTVAVAGCNPYVAAISATYGVATSDRSVATQASDAEIEGKIKASLLASPVQGTGSLSVFCQRGVVLLAGVVAPGSGTGRAAVNIAQATGGVVRVETFFVPSQPSSLNDDEIEGKIKAVFIADPNVIAGQVSVGVYAGHVVLVGVVNSQEQIDQFVADAQSVNGVVSVRSYIQIAG